MLFSIEQAFVGREEIRAPLKRPAWEASCFADLNTFPLKCHSMQEIKQDSLGFFRLKVPSVTYYPSVSVLFPFHLYDGVVLVCAVVCRLEVAGLK